MVMDVNSVTQEILQLASDRYLKCERPVASLDGDVGVGWGWRWGLVSGLEPIKKKSARQLSGCRKAHLAGFHKPRLLSPAFPGATRKTQASASLPVTHTHAWTHTHTR